MVFEELEVWKRACRLCCEIYRAAGALKDFGFRDQVCRSAVSVPSNIAEGMERSSYKDQMRYLDYARGSSAELRTQIYIGSEIGYFEKGDSRAWADESKEISAMLSGLQKRIKHKLKPNTKAPEKP